MVNKLRCKLNWDKSNQQYFVPQSVAVQILLLFVEAQEQQVVSALPLMIIIMMNKYSRALGLCNSQKFPFLFSRE